MCRCSAGAERDIDGELIEASSGDLGCDAVADGVELVGSVEGGGSCDLDVEG